jgi:hypothetical protein
MEWNIPTFVQISMKPEESSLKKILCIFKDIHQTHDPLLKHATNDLEER